MKKLKEKRLRLSDKHTGYDKKVILKTFELPNGLIESFFIDDDKSSVQILPITTDNKVILVKQYRPGVEEECIELPGGGIESNEDPTKAAIRELAEETGYKGDVEYISSINYSPYSNGIRHTFVATNCQKVSDLDLDPNEFLKVGKMSLDEFREKIKTGKIRGYEGAYLALDKLKLL